MNTLLSIFLPLLLLVSFSGIRCQKIERKDFGDLHKAEKYFLSTVSGVPIDNAITGEPEVQCGPTSIQLSFATDNPFGGVVYAKNHHSELECAAVGTGEAGGSLEMNFETCNVRRRRSLEPKGIYVTATIVVQFHEKVLTKVDRAFHIQCFYMEADKTVDAELEVSMVTTEFRTFIVPMPVCRYDILEENENGAPVRFVTIGQKVYHKWTCDTETTDTFCMEVYGCYVDDGSGSVESRIDLLDDEGCAQDLNLLSNLDYPTDLMAGQETHVFKYADRPQLYFNCQIRIGVKEPNGVCEDFRGELCPDPQATFGRKKRSASVHKVSSQQIGVMDVVPSNPVFVADVELSQDDIPSRLMSRLNHQRSFGPLLSPPAPTGPTISAVNGEPNATSCVGMSGLSGLLILMALLLTATICMSFLLCNKRSKGF